MIRIRPYLASDRSAVRRICCDTANAGKPIETLFKERVLGADMLMNYYTDYEPQNLWVAVRENDIIGYLAGTLDARVAQKIMTRRVFPQAIARAVSRGLLWNSDFWLLLKHNLRLPHPRRADVVDLAVYPAHLHINLTPISRGQGTGKKLLNKFFQQAAAARVPGVHVWVRSDNNLGLNFFKQEGFKELGLAPFIRTKTRSLLWSIGLGKLLYAPK